MSDYVDIDTEYIMNHYENGVEGAHACLASALSSILEAGENEIPGYTEEAYMVLIANHINIMDAMMRSMVVDSKPDLTVVKNDGDAA